MFIVKIMGFIIRFSTVHEGCSKQKLLSVYHPLCKTLQQEHPRVLKLSAARHVLSEDRSTLYNVPEAWDNQHFLF